MSADMRKQAQKCTASLCILMGLSIPPICSDEIISFLGCSPIPQFLLLLSSLLLEVFIIIKILELSIF
jgi:hypothetical protein